MYLPSLLPCILPSQYTPLVLKFELNSFSQLVAKVFKLVQKNAFGFGTTVDIEEGTFEVQRINRRVAE